MSGTRGFGATDGVGTTDSIVLAHTTHYDQVTYSFYMSRNGLGASNLGRVLQKGTTADTRPAIFSALNGADGLLRYAHPWTTVGEWNLRYTGTTAIAGDFFCFTYDGSSTSNAPLMWQGGAAQTVELQTAPTGSTVPNTEAWVIGNRRSDNARNHDGRIGVFGMWSRVLPPQDAIRLARGYSPLWFPVGLVAHVDMSLTVDSRNAGVTITGTKPIRDPMVIYPPWISAHSALTRSAA